MITVFGASGHTGGAAAAHLLKAGKKIRVVARHKEKLVRFTEEGAQAAVGDIENTSFVREALAGAEAAYLMIPPNLAADDFRAYQQRLVDVYVAGLEASEVRYAVLLSSVGAQHREGTGPIVALHAFEERLKRLSSLNALFLRAGVFMENVLYELSSIKGKGVYRASMPANAAVPAIASADIGSYAGSRLERLDFPGKSVVHLIGPKAVSQTELVALLGDAVGKPIRYQQTSFDEAEQAMRQAGMKPSLVSVFAEMQRAASKGLLVPEEGGTVAQGRTTFETFAKEVFAPAYRA
jgi:uncharacterized protein YbjT (DUF2867 family)